MSEPHPPLAPSDDGAPPYAATLNPPQQQAVLTTEGPVLMLAGAGTGKTAALTARLAHLIATRRAWPSEILCVTFTNKAAREMRERVARHIGQAVEGMPWLGTFHSIGAKMLRRHAELVGLQSNFTILDTDDQLRLLKQLITAADLESLIGGVNIALKSYNELLDHAGEPFRVAHDHLGHDVLLGRRDLVEGARRGNGVVARHAIERHRIGIEP